MNIKSKWPSYLVYISIAFLLTSLVVGDYAEIPVLVNPTYFIASFLLLLVGFVFNVLAWQKTLSISNFKCSLPYCFVSVGMTIFGKYVPGKIWSIVGRAGYISQYYSLPAPEISVASFRAQILTVWSGIILGLVYISLASTQSDWFIPSVVGLLVLSFSILTDAPQLMVTLANKLRGNKSPSIKLSSAATIPILHLFFLQWLAWCYGFYLFTQSIYPVALPLHTALGFALAATIGILSLFAPGGIGVREGVIFGVLYSCHPDPKLAATAAFANRLWFLAGEVGLFLFGILLKRKLPGRPLSAETSSASMNNPK
jgi:uncharacterized membrane protein YbhN (UPF0104 family)